MQDRSWLRMRKRGPPCAFCGCAFVGFWHKADTPRCPRILSAFGGTADIRQRRRLHWSDAIDPMYGPAVRCKKTFPSLRAVAVLHQCIRPLIGAFVLRAIMGISARAISLADRPQWTMCVTSVRIGRVVRSAISFLILSRACAR